MSYYWPMLLFVGSGTIYHIATKGTNQDVNAFVSLAVTYLLAMLACLVIYFVRSSEKNLFEEVGKINWATIVLGIVIVGLEVGNIFMYRAGWNISVGPLIANVSIVTALVFIGAFLYRESISLEKIVGIALCLGGFVLISK